VVPDDVPAVLTPAGRRRTRPGKVDADKGDDSTSNRAWLRRRGITARISRRGIESSQRPNFAPTPDFQEWDHIAPNVTFQLGEGTPGPPTRFGLGVGDLEAERDRVLGEARPPHASPIKRFEGLVALCDFVDPWGNAFGLYQVLFEGEPPALSGSAREHRTEVEAQLEGGGGPPTP
jgi:hypothetical protein